MAALTVPHTAAVWLTVSEAVVRARIHAAGRYREASDTERHLMDKFLARTSQYQVLMLDTLGRLGPPRIDVAGQTAGELASAVLAAASAPAG